MKYLRHLLMCGLLLGSAALFAQSGESGAINARLAERFLQEHPEFVKLFSFDKSTGTARCSDAKALESFESFKLAYPALTVEDFSSTATTEEVPQDQINAAPDPVRAGGHRGTKANRAGGKAEAAAQDIDVQPR